MPAIQSLSRLGISPLIQVTPLPVSQDTLAAKKTPTPKRSSSRRSKQNPANTASPSSTPASKAKPPSKLTREPLLALCAEQGVEIDLTKYKSNTAINRRRKEVLKERTAREKKEEQARLRLEKTRARQPSVARHLSPKRKKQSSAKKKVPIAAEASPLAGPNGDNLDDDPAATPSSSTQHRFTALAAGLAGADDSDDDEEEEGEDGEEELADLDDPLAAARRDGVDLDQLVKVLNCCSFDDKGTTSRRQEAVAEMQLTVSDARNKTQAHTEKSAQRLFAAWFRLVREDPVLEINDYIVDEYVAKLYIDWTFTRGCYNRRAQLEKGKRVDAATIDKAWSMLARLRKNQHAHSLRASPPVDLDQTRPFSTAQLLAFKDSCTVQATVHARDIAAVDLFSNTFLEFAAWDAGRVGAVAEGLFCKPQAPTILRSHLMFSWCMQSLNRLDDLVLTRLAYLSLSEIKIGKGEKVPVIVAQQFEGKTRQKKSKKKAHFAILAPHRDFRVCAVGSLAAFLYYLFDESKITSNEKWTGVDWNWNDDASWRPIYLMAGVLNAQTHLSKTTLTRSFTILFEAMGIISSKKGHLGRVVGGWLMESLGCPENEILRTGDWKGDIYQTVYASQIPRTGIKTAAGFEHDEAMSWPRLEVEIPEELLQGVFGWVESTLAMPVTPSARRFLLLLIFLRKHFIIHFANWYQTNSNSVVFSSLAIFKGGDSNPYICWLRDSFPVLLAAQEAKAKAADALLAEVKDAATRSLLSVLLRNTETLQTSMSSFEVMVERRTADLSPSKRSRLPEDDEASDSGDDDEPSSSSSSKRRPPPSRPSQPRLLSASSFLPPHSPAHLPPSPSCPPPSTSSFNPSSASPSTSSSPSRLPAPATLRRPESSVTGSLDRPASRQSTPPPSSTDAAAQPATPKRPRAEFDGPQPSPRRLHITPTLSSSDPAPACAYDFLLPPDLAFSSLPNDPSPPAPVFRQPATWTTILDAVKQPKAVWEVWGPKQPGQYAGLSEVWAHWAVEGVGVDAAGRPGRVPPISELEKRWPSRNKKLDQRWSGGLADAPRRRLAQFRLLIKALQERQGPSTSSQDAAQALAAELGIPSNQVAAIGEALRKRSAAASGGRRKKKRVEEEVEVEEPLPTD